MPSLHGGPLKFTRSFPLLKTDLDCQLDGQLLALNILSRIVLLQELTNSFSVPADSVGFPFMVGSTWIRLIECK